MALIDTGLVVRYYVDEAASGITPTAVLDAASGAAFNLAIGYHDSKLAYTEVSGNRGLESISTADAQIASKLINNTSDKVRDAMVGKQVCTLEVVIDVHSVDTGGNGSKIFGIDETTVAGGGQFQLRAGHSSYTTSFYLRWNNQVTDYWDLGAAARAVFHIVVDTTQADSNNRVKVYRDGSVITTNIANAIAQNDTLVMPNGSEINMFNNSVLVADSFDGILYYAAIYNVAMSAADCAANYAVLTADDDIPEAGESGSGSGYPEDHELVIADMTLALTFDGLALTQAQTLSVAGMAMALNLEALALTQNHALTIADIAMALGFDAPALTQAQLLAVDDVAMGAVYGEPTLAQDHTLAVANMAHALNFDSPALVQASVLVVDDIVCALVFGTPTLMTGTVLVVNDMALALTFDEPTVTQDHTLSVADMNIALILDAFGITQAQTILVNDMTLDLLFDSITLPGTVVSVVPGAGTPCGTWASRDRCGLVGPKIRYLGKKCGLVGPKPKRCED